VLPGVGVSSPIRHTAGYFVVTFEPMCKRPMRLRRVPADVSPQLSSAALAGLRRTDHASAATIAVRLGARHVSRCSRLRITRDLHADCPGFPMREKGAYCRMRCSGPWQVQPRGFAVARQGPVFYAPDCALLPSCASGVGGQRLVSRPLNLPVRNSACYLNGGLL
jgi:hypothetical protein